METNDTLTRPVRRREEVWADQSLSTFAKAQEIDHINRWEVSQGPLPPPAVTEEHRAAARQIAAALEALRTRIAALDAKVARLTGVPEKLEQRLECIRLLVLGLNNDEIHLEISATDVPEFGDPENLTEQQVTEIVGLKTKVEQTKLFLNNAAAERTRLAQMVNVELEKLEAQLRRLKRWNSLSPGGPVFSTASGHDLQSKIAAAQTEIKRLLE